MCGQGHGFGDQDNRSPSEGYDADAGQGDGETALEAGVTRITTDLADRIGKWGGIDNCCDKTTAMGHLRNYFDVWVAETLAAHPGRTVAGSGWYDGQIKCSPSRKHPFGERRCRGWFTRIMCYVDLA